MAFIVDLESQFINTKRIFFNIFPFSNIYRDVQTFLDQPTHTLSGIDIISLCFDARVALIDITAEAKRLIDPDILKTNYEIIFVKVSEIAEHREANLREENFDVKALRTFLNEIKDKHLNDLEPLLNKAEDYIDKPFHQLEMRIQTIFSKIWAKLNAVNSEIEKHPELLPDIGIDVFQSAVDKLHVIDRAYSMKEGSKDQKLEKLNAAILSIPELKGQIRTLKSYLLVTRISRRKL